MVTLKELAQLAGVSTMTVSNVLNQRTDKVSPATREKIEALVTQLHYVPNQNARSLAGADSLLIAVIDYTETVEDTQLVFSAPFMAALISELESAVRAAHHFMLVRHVNSVEEIALLQQNWQLAGLVIVGMAPAYLAKVLASVHVPVAFIDTPITAIELKTLAPKQRVGVFALDDAGGAKAAVAELLAGGAKHLGFLGYSFTATGVESRRLAGYREALQASGEPVYVLPAGEAAFATVAWRAEHHQLDAVVTTADTLAAQLMAYLHAHTRLKIPQDLSIVGFDDQPFAAWMEMTTVAQDTAARALAAVDFLTVSKTPLLLTTQPVKLIRRGTTRQP
ncbi:LacI family DNA-binding transcriptional regulator [Lacticaseibacillus baoqingensis]|uniref:LacI family DNA-binding transcriptional regulator n=1 Tax=Lacticaseibacillus baoqingensis TaxID=2486013 RepID=A0ABW4E3C9_9LACO|nr:LacI family DNA-binding transcriptional regulator [Lacticaseibacillus baoqingensis]